MHSALFMLVLIVLVVVGPAASLLAIPPTPSNAPSVRASRGVHNQPLRPSARTEASASSNERQGACGPPAAEAGDVRWL